MDAADEAPATTRNTKAQGARCMSAGDILTWLRHHNVPCSIDSFAAKGWTAKLGDPTNGFYAQQSGFRTIDAAAHWLIEEHETRSRRQVSRTSRLSPESGDARVEQRGGGEAQGGG
jgi:hypothetical protein